MKTLIIIAHPDIDASIANKNWLEAVEKHPEDYTIHELYKVYPDEKINIEREQQLLLNTIKSYCNFLYIGLVAHHF